MSLVRSGLVVASATVALRILGFLRDLLFALVFGAGPVADAFLATYRFLDVIRRLVSEGGLGSALVPVMTALARPRLATFAGEVLGVFALAALAFSALVWLGADGIVLAMAPGLEAQPGALDLAAATTRLAWPLAIAVFLASIPIAALNVDRRFAVAAFAPAAVTLAMIAALLALRHAMIEPREAMLVLAISLSLGGLAQLVLLGIAARQSGLLAWRRPRSSPELRRIAGTAPLAVAASGATLLFHLAGTQAASLFPSGVSWLFYADRLAYLPVTFVVAVVTALLLPALARQHQSGNRNGVIAAQNRALEVALLLACPAGLAFAVLAEPIVAVLFQRGAFGPEDTQGTAVLLAALGLGLPPIAASKILVQTLFARGGAVEALLAALVGLAATVAASFGLASLIGIAGVGWGVTLGYVVYTLALVAFLRRSGLWRLDGALRDRLARIVVACGILWGALRGAQDWLGTATPLTLALLCAGGLLVYGAAAWIVGAVTQEDRALLRARL